MQFTGEEIVCLNSILGGDKLEWIELPIIPFEKREDYINGTIGTMREKRLVARTGQLTQTGQLALRVLEEYKKAKIKLLINNLRIAIVDTEIVVLIAKVQEEYEITFELKKNIIATVIISYPFLEKKQEKKIKRDSKYLSYGEWEKEIENITEKNSLLVSKCCDKKLTEQRIYYWNEKGACCYHPIKKIQYKKGSNDIKKEILTLIEGEMEDNERISH